MQQSDRSCRIKENKIKTAQSITIIKQHTNYKITTSILCTFKLQAILFLCRLFVT